MTPPHDTGEAAGEPDSAEILGPPREEGSGASSSSAMGGVRPGANDPLTLSNGIGSEPLPVLTPKSTAAPSPLTLRDRPPPAAPRVVRLMTVRGEQLGQEYPLLPGKNFLGRSTPEKPADIDLTAQERVEQVWASRQHAVITLDGDLLTLEDLNSLNGTFVNRVRLYPGQRATLRSGDVVQVGTVQLRVEG